MCGGGCVQRDGLISTRRKGAVPGTNKAQVVPREGCLARAKGDGKGEGRVAGDGWSEGRYPPKRSKDAGFDLDQPLRVCAVRGAVPSTEARARTWIRSGMTKV